MREITNCNIDKAVFTLRNGDWKQISFSTWKIAKKLKVASNNYKETALKPGGMIILSGEINATSKPGLLNKIKSWLKSKVQTYITRQQKVRETMEKEIQKENIDDIGWTIGNLWDGRFSTKIDGEVKTFDEKSFAVDIADVDFDFIKKLAKRFLDEFEQQAVLVINHKDGSRMLIEKDQSKSLAAASSEAYWINSKTGEKYKVTGGVHSNWINNKENAKKVGLSDEVFAEISQLKYPQDDDKIRRLVIENTNLIRMRAYGSALVFEFSSSSPKKTIWTIYDFLRKYGAGPLTRIVIANILPSGIVHSFNGSYTEFEKALMESDAKILTKSGQIASVDRKLKIANQLASC